MGLFIFNRHPEFISGSHRTGKRLAKQARYLASGVLK
jgi:hypothetical protein